MPVVAGGLFPSRRRDAAGAPAGCLMTVPWPDPREARPGGRPGRALAVDERVVGACSRAAGRVREGSDAIVGVQGCC